MDVNKIQAYQNMFGARPIQQIDGQQYIARVNAVNFDPQRANPNITRMMDNMGNGELPTTSTPPGNTFDSNKLWK